MEASSLFPSSDNLWKFLFLGGIFMVVFAIVYPLEKKQSLEIESNAFKKDTAIIKEEMKHLLTQINEANESLELTISKIQNLKNSNSAASKAEVEKLLKESTAQVFEIREKRVANEIKAISLSYEKERINLLKKHISDFDIFKFIFIIVGGLSFLIGLGFWIRLTNRLEEIQLKELNS